MRDEYHEEAGSQWKEPEWPYSGKHFQEPEEKRFVPPPKRKHKQVSVYLLSIIQISVCAVILLAAVLFKSFGGQAYTAVRDWYLTNINQSIMTQEKLDDVKQSVIDLFPRASSSSNVGSGNSESVSSNADSQQSGAGGQESAETPSQPSPESAQEGGAQGNGQ